MRIIPLEWGPDGQCTNPELFGKVMEFTEREFGARHAGLPGFKRVFAVQRDNGEVNALTGINLRFDVPMFHVAQPTGRPAQRDALVATDLCYARLVSYIEDMGGKGVDTFVYVAPDAQGRWAKWLDGKGAKQAHRYVVIP